MADTWHNVKRDGMPPCDGETVFVGINTAGFACCFNEATPDGVCSMHGPELSTVQMSGLHWWRALDRPDGAATVEAPSSEAVAEDRRAVLQLLYEAHHREPCGPTLEAISAAIQHLQAVGGA